MAEIEDIEDQEFIEEKLAALQAELDELYEREEAAKNKTTPKKSVPGYAKQMAELQAEMDNLHLTDAESQLDRFQAESEAKDKKIHSLEVEMLTKEDSEELAAARANKEHVALGIAQLETDDYFYQGEVIKGTEIFHGTATLVSKASLTKFVGTFDNGKKCGDGQLEWINPESMCSDYIGGFVEDKFQGMGILQYRNGKIFKGEFEIGVPIEGILTYPNGDEYVGCVMGDKRNGYGILKQEDGQVQYQGEYLDDVRQGQGIETKVQLGDIQTITGVYEKGVLKMGQWKCRDDQYFGEFSEAEVLFEGQGVYQYGNGDFYQGTFKTGLRSGWGTFKDHTSTYEGNWIEGSKEHGTMRYQNSGDVYVGTFSEDGQKDCGVLTYPNGDEFSGSFLNGAKEMGLLTLIESGSVYKGQFENGLPEGSGELITKDGDIYRGEFSNGVKNGQGLLELKDNGGTYIGEFKDDVMHGNGHFTMPDGSEYIGEFLEGVQHGDGMITTVGGVQIRGRWDQGKYQSLEYNFRLDTSEEPADEDKVVEEKPKELPKNQLCPLQMVGYDPCKQRHCQACQNRVDSMYEQMLDKAAEEIKSISLPIDSTDSTDSTTIASEANSEINDQSDQKSVEQSSEVTKESDEQPALVAEIKEDAIEPKEI